tara:strand:- start:64 stop:318 length:255 start_codon:yes stop_codon:yes gene_type:complete
MNNNNEYIQLKMMGIGVPDIGTIEDRQSIFIFREDYDYLSDDEWNTLIENEEELIHMMNDEIEELIDENIITYVDVIVGNKNNK